MSEHAYHSPGLSWNKSSSLNCCLNNIRLFTDSCWELPVFTAGLHFTPQHAGPDSCKNRNLEGNKLIPFDSSSCHHEEKQLANISPVSVSVNFLKNFYTEETERFLLKDTCFFIKETSFLICSENAAVLGADAVEACTCYLPSCKELCSYKENASVSLRFKAHNTELDWPLLSI